MSVHKRTKYAVRGPSRNRHDNRVIRHLNEVADILSRSGMESAAEIVNAYIRDKKEKDEARRACGEGRSGAKYSDCEAGFRDASVSPSRSQTTQAP
jgi:hypothetical protein